MVSLVFSLDQCTHFFSLLLLELFSNNEGISFVSPRISFVSLVVFSPLSPLYFHADLSCFSLLTHLFIFLSDGCSQVSYTSSCLSLWNISLCTYKTWPIFFVHLHTHKYILMSCILMLYIQNLSEPCKEFPFLGLRNSTSFLFSLFVP